MITDKFMDRTFYLSGIFADIRTRQAWTTNEIKLVMLLFSKISEHKIYYPDFYGLEESEIMGKISALIKSIPRDYEITRKDFQQVTNCRPDNLLREIKKTRESLSEKVIHTPHPLDPRDINSGESIAWFSKISYLDSDKMIYIKLNDESLDRLVLFAKYSNINFKYLCGIKNHNSILIYLSIKLAKDASRKKILNISLIKLKDKLSLTGKYEKITQFREKVLDIVKKEINEHTDLIFDYSLIKKGRSFDEVEFKFDSKPNYIENDDHSTEQIQLTDNSPSSFNDTKNITLKCYIEGELNRYGIKKNKIAYLIQTYGYETIDTSIESVRTEIKNGKEIKNIAGYLLKCIENNEPKITASELKIELDQESEIETKEKLEIENKWQQVEKFCSEKESLLNDLYLSIDSNTELFDQELIDFLDELKMFLEFYHDFISCQRVIKGVYVNDGKVGIGFPVLLHLTKNSVLAPPSKRLPHIKKSIIDKQNSLAVATSKLDKDAINNSIKDLNNILLSLI